MDDCPICYESVDDSTGHCTLSCKHSFHIACLTKWGKDNPSCPMCRKELGTTEIAPRPRHVLHLSEEFAFHEVFRTTWHGMRGDAPLEPRDERTVDVGGGVILEERDIALVMAQAGASRDDTIRSLRRHDGDIVNSIMELTSDHPPPPPGPPPPENRLLHIGGDVRVTENDIEHVMEVAHTDRGMAVRALRMHRGDAMDAISWISMLPPVVHLRPPPPRDPVSEPSDEQATAWFIHKMFREEGVSGYHWNSYSDMVGRTKTTTRNRNEFWMHLQFNGFENEGGYESA